MKPRPFLNSGFVATSVIVTLIVSSAGARAQVPGRGDPDKYGSARVTGTASEVGITGARMPDWGTSSTSILRIGSSSFAPNSSSSLWDGAGGWLMGTNPAQPPPLHFSASLQLPSGALIKSFAAEVYDNSGPGDITVWIEACQNLNGACVTTPTVTTSGTPLFMWLTSTLSSPITIDNSANNYVVWVDLGSRDPGNAFRSVVINYQLQVSPAPAFATFADVPRG